MSNDAYEVLVGAIRTNKPAVHSIESLLIIFSLSSRFRDNPRLHKVAQNKKHVKLITGIAVGAFVLLLVIFLGSLLCLRNLRRKASQTKSSDGKGT